jgi:hypothetical protein
MKDLFEEINKNKAMMDGFVYGNTILKKIRRKWFNPFRYIMGEITTKRINPKKIF